MNITNKFVNSGTRKFERKECSTYLRTTSRNWPQVGIEVHFSARQNDVGDIEVQMSNDEAEEFAIELLKQAVLNRKYTAGCVAKQQGGSK